MDRNEYQNPEDVRVIIKYWFYSRILCCVGLLILFVTLITPNWVRITSTLSRINLGLWTICIEDSCRMVTGYSSILDSCRILMSVGTFCGLVAVASALISNPRLSQSRWPLITNFATALISVIAILLFFLSVIDKITFIDDEEEEDFRYVFSFSFFGSCVGCIFFFIAGVLFALIKIKESAIIIPMSEDQEEPPSRTSLPEREKIGVFENNTATIQWAYGVM